MNRSPLLAEDPQVQQLAGAMRAGLERRHFLSPVAFQRAAADPTAPEAGAALLQYADLVSFPAVARPGPCGRLVRLLRAAARPLFRPWLAVQTEFNRQTLETLQAVRRELGLLRARVEELGEHSEECPPNVATWDTPAGLTAAPAAECVLERVFVHTRLPPPPACVLTLGGAACTHALELASFGYRVAAVARPPRAARHPALVMVHADAGRLPLPPDQFDVAVYLHDGRVGQTFRPALENSGTTECLPHQALAEIRRVLRPRGRVLLSLPFGRLGRLRHGLRPVETLYGIRAGAAWSVTSDAGVAGRTEAGAGGRAVALVVAEKS